MGSKPMPDKTYRFLSQPRRVVEDRRFVAGKGHYIADYDHADMAHVALMPCHLPAARIDAIDASAALAISNAPFEGPTATVRVGRIWTDDGPQFVINPTGSQMDYSDLDLVLAGHADGINMIEVGAAEIPDEEKLAVTIVTGFLGAGKTTLVNYILNEQHGKKICVIENEFGAVNIDQALVAENISSAEELISMDNGCACCTVRGDLVKALIGLKDRRKDFDAVLLETTGLADPAPILQTFDSNPVLQNNYRIDCVTTLVDVKFIKQHLDEVRPEGTVNEAVQQVAFADRVVINKVDLVSKEELRSVKDTVYATRNSARTSAQLGAIF